MTKEDNIKRVISVKTVFIIFGLFLNLSASQVVSAQSVTSATSSAQSIYSKSILFNNDLRMGSTGDDVKRLQQYLNTTGFPLTDSGLGSLGKETTYFGRLTKDSLMRLQKKFEQDILTPLGLTSPTGNFYTSTRTFVNNNLLKKVVTSNLLVNEEIVPEKSLKRSGRLFTRYYDVTASGDDNMSITSDSDQSVAAGGTRSFTVTADTGYEISTLAGGTCPTGSWSGSIYTTGEITDSCSVVFAANVLTYTVTLIGDGISPAGAQTVSYGETQSFTVEDGVGYGLGTIESTCPGGSWTHATYTTGPITAPCSVSFEPGSISGSIGSTIATSQSLFLRQNGNNFEYSLFGSDWDSFALLPTITNTGGDTLTVYLLGDFTLSNVNSYIVVDSDNITIQGETDKDGPTVITIDGVTNYPGFIKNGSDTANGFDNITISNIFVNSVGSTLAQNGGWLAQEYFGVGATNNEINLCGSNGNISEHSGGIVGARSANITISDCFTTGAIAINAGGIVGAIADTVTVENSYSSGVINVAAGGIFGGSAYNSVAQNTYSTGLIGGDAGGIFGEAHDNPTVVNSYTSGHAMSDGKGILAGSSLDGVSNYSESNNSNSSGWNSTNASSVLTNINTVWKSVGVSLPYKLLGFNASPYEDSTQTLSASESSSAVLGYYNSCSILSISGGDVQSHDEITINSDTGVVSTTNNVENGTYNILVFCNSIHDTYTISTLELTVN
jgi:hypothetical protein